MTDHSPADADLEQILRSALGQHRLSDDLFQKFVILMRRLLEAQGRLNVTAVREPEVMAVVHFADSLTGLEADDTLTRARRAADIGPGGGFPILPLAALLPGCDWVAIESVAKKCRFIEESASAMGLTNVNGEPRRAEEAGRGPLRGTLHVVTARAVGPTAALLEVGMPLLREGGHLLLYKTEAALEEWTAAQSFLKKLGGKPLPEHRYRFDGDRQERVILRAERIGPIPGEFPRLPGLPFKKPLA